jgi:hypothetical protein
MRNRLTRFIAVAALSAAPLTMALPTAQAQDATPASVADDKPEKSGKKTAKKTAKKEKPDPAWKEAYERLHEPREKSEQIELARERQQAGR